MNSVATSPPAQKAHRDAPARRFCGAFAGVFVVGLLVIAIFNLVIDPYGNGTGWFMPIVKSSRPEKLWLLAAGPQPHGLVLGSSRVLKLEPAYLQEVTGNSFFNAGVNYARPEDYLALVRAFHSQFNTWPERLVIGVDVDAFTETPGIPSELLRERRLRLHVATYLSWEDRLLPLRELWSWQQTRSSLRSFLHQAHHQGESLPEETYTPDGRLVYHRREAELAAGQYDWRSAYVYDAQTYLRMFRGYKSLSPMRQVAWRELMAICQQHNIILHVFLTPLHPELAAHLVPVGFANRHAEVTKFLRESLPTGAVFGDFTNIAAFGGDAKLFLDGVHMLEPNTRRLIDKLLSTQSGEVPDAFQ